MAILAKTPPMGFNTWNSFGLGFIPYRASKLQNKSKDNTSPPIQDASMARKPTIRTYSFDHIRKEPIT